MGRPRRRGPGGRAGPRAAAPPPPPPAGPAPAGGAVPRRVNRQREEPIGSASIDLLVRPDPEPAGPPVAPTGSLLPLVERWRSTAAHAGYDVRGDLAMLTEETLANALPGVRDQLGVAVEALADALVENAGLKSRIADLEHERDRLDRKRLKWKHRAKSVRAG